MLRKIMLSLAGNPRFVRVIASFGRRYGLTRRFIAGESFEEAIPRIRELELWQLDTTLDLLGEGVKQEQDSRLAGEAYRRLLVQLREAGLKSTISIKPTQLGLDISRELCSENLALILEEAAALGNFVQMDMEGSAYTQATLDVFREQLLRFGPECLGIVLQAYLFRSEKDVRDLLPTRCSIRLCKGAYMEPPAIAFPRKRDVDKSFKRLLDRMLGSGVYTAIATHDERMIEHARRLISERGVRPDQYEFQMLYGVRRELQLRLRREGFPMRIYVPFGVQWAPYFMRRLAERPANLLFILRNFLKA